eukprot:1161225-Pelagomonas_calceolata.AAC.28
MRKLAKKGINSEFGSWAKLTQLKALQAIAIEKNIMMFLVLDFTPTLITNNSTTQSFTGLGLQAVDTKLKPTHIPHDSFPAIGQDALGLANPLVLPVAGNSFPHYSVAGKVTAWEVIVSRSKFTSMRIGLHSLGGLSILKSAGGGCGEGDRLSIQNCSKLWTCVVESGVARSISTAS